MNRLFWNGGRLHPASEQCVFHSWVLVAQFWALITCVTYQMCCQHCNDAVKAFKSCLCTIKKEDCAHIHCMRSVRMFPHFFGHVSEYKLHTDIAGNCVVARCKHTLNIQERFSFLRHGAAAIQSQFYNTIAS